VPESVILFDDNSSFSSLARPCKPYVGRVIEVVQRLFKPGHMRVCVIRRRPPRHRTKSNAAEVSV